MIYFDTACVIKLLLRSIAYQQLSGKIQQLNTGPSWSPIPSPPLIPD